MKCNKALIFIWIIIAPIICAIVAKLAAGHFVWVMLFAVAYTISIILLTKGGNMEEHKGGFRKKFIEFANDLFIDNEQVSQLQSELEQKDALIKQCETEKAQLCHEIEKLKGRIEELESKYKEMQYRWQLWQDWAKLLQKRYYDESSERQDEIRRQLEDCGFSLVHYSAEYEEWFTIEVLNRLADEPEYKETKPALIFMNDGNKELVNKGTLLKFVEENN